MSIVIQDSAGHMTQSDGDLRYIKRSGGDTLVASGTTIYFDDAGTNLRIKNGVLQIKNKSDGGWHDVEVENQEGTGIAHLVIAEEGE